MIRLLRAIPPVCGLLAVLLPSTAAAERRVALVIGNLAYRHASPLPNSINDATAIATLFKKAEFDVVELRQNLGVVEFKRAVREFMTLAGNSDIAVVYYAGHGIEAAGNNYLIPVDAKLASDYDAEDEAISLDRVVQAMQPAQRLRLIILDACRENPFGSKMQRTVAVRAVTTGLAKVEPMTTDTLIAYAAKAGSVSYDGTGPNSPFTTALLKYLAEPGVDIRIALGRVRDEVLKSTQRRQEPFVYGSLGGTTVALIPAPDSKKAELPSWAADPNMISRSDYELTERIGTRQAWESFLAVHDKGLYADLARAQLDKLSAAQATEREARGRAENEQADRLARQRQEEEQAKAEAERRDAERLAAVKAERLAPQRQDEERAKAEAAQREAERVAALQAEGLALQRQEEERQRATKAERHQPGREAALQPAAKADPAQQAQACRHDAERLERLRAKPTPEEVARFAQEIVCDEVRLQVLRLLESVTPGPAEIAQPGTERRKTEREAAVPQPKTEPDPKRLELACRRDEERLVRLRANPSRDDVVRFARDLACEELRPQVQRLLESVGG